MKLVVVLGAIVAMVVAVVTAIYVDYEGYGTVLRQVALVALPWLAVWSAFRLDYGIVAATFCLIGALSLWQGIGWQVATASFAVAAVSLARAIVASSVVHGRQQRTRDP